MALKEDIETGECHNNNDEKSNHVHVLSPSCQSSAHTTATNDNNNNNKSNNKEKSDTYDKENNSDNENGSLSYDTTITTATDSGQCFTVHLSPATQYESEAVLGVVDAGNKDDNTISNNNGSKNDNGNSGSTTKRVFSRQPTSNLRGGGMRLNNTTNSARRAASGVYSFLVWIGEQLSISYTRWDRMRIDSPWLGFLFLLLAVVFMIVVVVPMVIIVAFVFGLLYCVAILTDSICS